MRRSEFYRAGSLVFLGACLAASAALVGCGEERNQEPTVRISASSLAIVQGESVTIDGSESSDPDGDPLRFYWELSAPEGSAVQFDDLRTETVTFVADVAGSYTVSLSVSDGEFRTDPESVTIEASSGVVEEGAPVAKTGADRTVELGAEVLLDGSDSTDPEGAALTYAWTLSSSPSGSSAALSDATAVQARFTPDKVGDYHVSLKVSNGTYTSAPAQVVISAVEEINEFAPIADAGADQQGAVGTPVNLDGSGSSNPNGSDADLRYFWTFQSQPENSGVIAINRPSSPDAWFLPDAEGTYVLRLEVRDAEENLSTDTVSIEIERLPSDVTLMISGYLQGSSQNKAVALYNFGSAPVDLTRVRFCIFANDEVTSCSYDAAITRTISTHPDGTDMLGAGEVLTICEGRVSLPGFVADDCDRSQGTYLANLNGDDRFLIYENTDGNEAFTGVDLVIDAFGQTAMQPADTIWKDKTFLRCNFDLYDGAAPFAAADYFNVRSKDFITGFADAPSEGCD